MASTKWWEELIDFSKNFDYFHKIDEEEKNNISKKLKALDQNPYPKLDLTLNLGPYPESYPDSDPYITATFNRLCWNYVVGKDWSDKKKEQLKYINNKKVKFLTDDELEGLFEYLCKNHPQYNGKLKKLEEIKVDSKETINFFNEAVQCIGLVFPNAIICSGNLKKVDFRYSVFLKEADFMVATFSKNAFFEGAIFSKHAFFIRATFLRDTDFSGAKFLEKSDFSGAKFLDNVYFRSATFSQEANFSGIKFPKEADFREATFLENVYFIGVEFSKEADFRGNIFLKEADFSGAKFSAKADFRKAEFSEKADFVCAEFSEDAKPPTTFREAEFSANADFTNTTFSKTTDFRDATFSAKADFKNARFSQDAYFRGAAFSENADFKNARFCGHSYFNNSEFKRGAYFQKVIFSKRVPEFLDAELKEDTSFSGVQWPEKAQDKEEANMQTRAYERLSLIMKGHERKKCESFFLGKQMEIQRLFEKDIIYKVINWLDKITSNYGNSLQRLFCWFAGTVGLFGFIYYWMISSYSNCNATEAEKVNYGFEAFKVNLSNILIFLKLEINVNLEIEGCIIPLRKLGDFFDFLQIFQIILSSIFLFLLLRTLRNKFRTFK